MKQVPYTAKIVQRKDITFDLFCLWLQIEPDKRFAFRPGQYCTIGINDIWRPYSIVSAPHEAMIELFVELVPPPEGNLTPLLKTLKVGDTVSLLPKAKGVFTFDPKFKNQVMVATVTGIAPFLSMIRDYIHRQEAGHNFYILHGASYMDEFGYYEELSNLESTSSLDMTVIYVPTVSRPDEARNLGWEHRETGRVNIILEDFLEGLRLSPAHTLIYACGHPGMIEYVKTRLAPKGWRVKEERYWK